MDLHGSSSRHPTAFRLSAALLELEADTVEWGGEIRGKLTWNVHWDEDQRVTALSVELVQTGSIKVLTSDALASQLVVADGRVTGHSSTALEPFGEDVGCLCPYHFELTAPSGMESGGYWIVRPSVRTRACLGETVSHLPGVLVHVVPPSRLLTVIRAACAVTGLSHCSWTVNDTVVRVELRPEVNARTRFDSARLELQHDARGVWGNFILETFLHDRDWMPTRQKLMRIEIAAIRIPDATAIFEGMLRPWLHPELGALPVPSAVPVPHHEHLPRPAGPPAPDTDQLPLPADGGKS
jgi:hypothetical protein